MPHDIQKASCWIQFDHPMFHSYAKHDADGFCSWTQIISGDRFCVQLRPKGFEKFKARREINQACTPYLSESPTKNGFYGEESDRFVIYAQEGDIVYV